MLRYRSFPNDLRNSLSSEGLKFFKSTFSIKSFNSNQIKSPSLIPPSPLWGEGKGEGWDFSIFKYLQRIKEIFNFKGGCFRRIRAVHHVLFNIAGKLAPQSPFFCLLRVSGSHQLPCF